MSVILNFMTMLRYFGLPVSPDETIMAQKAYQLLGLEQRERIRYGLRAAVVKKKEDLHIFDECFNAYFDNKKFKYEMNYKEKGNKFLNRLEQSPQKIDHEIGQLLLQNQVDEAIQLAQGVVDMNNGISLGQSVTDELIRIQENLKRTFRLSFGIPVPIRGLTPSQRQLLPISTLRLAANLQMFEHGLKSEYQNELRSQKQEKPADIPNPESFLFQDLNQLSQTIMNVKEQLLEIGRLLASRERRHRERAKKGKLDFRRTFRKNLANNGIPIELVQKHKRIQDPEIVILNDVSGSTRWVADWFFVISYAAREVFRKVRIFEFDNTMVEVTEALDRKTIDRALEERSKSWEKTLRKRRIHSDYQTSLEDFFHLTKYHPINRRTTILVLGDCRDNEGMWTINNPISADLIRKISILGKRVLILNPEDENQWNTGDSVVNHYQTAGAEVFHVATLKDLVEFVFTIK
ncbi:MAG: VWA domain-containing protein [Candidatus Hodarchaeota archaeon]